MFGRLLPRETSFFDFFEEEAALTVAGARELERLISGEGDAHALIKRISELETEADTITHRCVEALHRTFVTPIERDDIHTLISRLDDILDHIEEAAECIGLYRLARLREDARKLASILVRCTLAVEAQVALMRDMRNAERISASAIELQRLEHEGDTHFRRAMATLFEEEADLRELIKWKEIYENLEEAIDRCEDVANIVEGVVLEQT